MLMVFSSPIRDVISALIAGCLSFAIHTTRAQGPSNAPNLSNTDIIAPHAQPQPFAPGIVASKYDEWATSFTPDNKTVFFSRLRQQPPAGGSHKQRTQSKFPSLVCRSAARRQLE